MRKLSILLISCLLAGCMTLPRARMYFVDHPHDFADLSARFFPCIDSQGAIPVYKPADNRDYTGEIDSMQQAGEELRMRLQVDQHAADSISRACGDLVVSYTRQVTDLTARISVLKEMYRKCRADTVPAPYPVINTAAVDSANAGKDRLLQDIATKDGRIEELRRTNTHLWIAIAVLAAALILTITLRIKNFL